MIGRVPRPPARGFVCDRCKQPARVLYVQRSQLCERCAYPECYSANPPRRAPEWARGLVQLELFS